MRKILMIGDFNTITQDVYRYLTARFYVQFCPGDPNLAESMYRLVLPELVLVSLIGLGEESRPLFGELEKNHPGTPVVCLGNQEELKLFMQETNGEQFTHIVRPVTIQEITDHIFIQLKMPVGSAGLAMRDQFTGKKRILIVDDSAVQLRTMKGLLQDYYQVDMATSAKEAMVLIYKHVPDLIFLDYDMPQCDGKETFEMIKNDPMSGAVPVIFLTGVSERKKVLSVLNMYPADYLVKPVEKQRIIEAIQNVLGA